MKTFLQKTTRKIKTLFVNKKRQEKVKRLKTLFKLYFEGVPGMAIQAIRPIAISSMGITNLQFKFKKSVIVITVTLERPGILIGRHGSTIEGLEKYLTEDGHEVKIGIKESNIWA